MSDPNAYKRQRMAERLNFEDRTKALRTGRASMRSVRSSTTISSFVSQEQGSIVIELSSAVTNGVKELFIHRYDGLELTPSDFATLHKWSRSMGFDKTWIEGRHEHDLPPVVRDEDLDDEEPLPELLEATGPRSGEPIWTVVSEEASSDGDLLKEASNSEGVWDFGSSR